jgi:RNA polymerase sigma-70 factor (ECF subfamily)
MATTEAVDRDSDYGDAILLSHAASGDLAAFEKLEARYQDFAYAVALRYSSNPDLANDIVAESFERVFRSAARFEGKSRFATWLYRIVVNCAKDEDRRSRSRHEVGLEGAADLRFIEDDRLELAESVREALRIAIKEMPALDRTLILGHYRDHTPYDRLADAVGVPVGTVKSRLYRVRAKLRRRLARWQNQLFE